MAPSFFGSSQDFYRTHISALTEVTIQIQCFEAGDMSSESCEVKWPLQQ